MTMKPPPILTAHAGLCQIFQCIRLTDGKASSSLWDLSGTAPATGLSELAMDQ